MRIRSVTFHHAWPFKGLEPISLGPRVTIFVGDNEAGKSSIRRAIEALLFGPTTETAAPLAVARFHVEAHVELDDGRSFAMTRKGRGVSPAEAGDALTHVLPPSHRTRFRELYQLGPEEIRGDVVRFFGEQGYFGGLLAAAEAGLGPTRLATMATTLEARISELKSTAQGRDGVGRLLQKHAAAATPQTPEVDFAAFDADAEEDLRLERDHRAIDERIRSHGATIEAHRKLRESHGALLRLSALRSELGALLDPGASATSHAIEEAKGALEAHVNAADALARARGHLSAAVADRDALPAPGPLATFADRCAALASRASGHEERMRQVADLRMQRDRYEARVRELLATAGLGGQRAAEDVAAARDLRLGTPERKRIDARAARVLEAREEQRRAAVTRDALRDRVTQTSVPEPDATRVVALEEAKRAFDAFARAAREREVAEEQWQRQRADAAQRALRLGLAESALDEPATATVGEGSSIRARGREALARREAAATARQEADGSRRRAADASRVAEETRARVGGAPDEGVLLGARALRDAAMEDLAASLRADAPRTGDAPESSLARLRVAIRASDVAADARFARAHEIGQLDAALREARRLDEEAEVLREAADDADRASAAARAAYARDFPFLADPPEDVDRYLDDLERYRDAVFLLRGAVREVDRCSREAATRLESLTRALATALPTAPDPSDQDALAACIDAALSFARTRLAEEERATAEAKSLARALEKAETDLTHAERALTFAVEEFASCTLPPSLRGDASAAREFVRMQDELDRVLRELDVANEGIGSGDVALSAFEADLAALLTDVRAAGGGEPAAGLSAADRARAVALLARAEAERGERRAEADRLLDDRRNACDAAEQAFGRAVARLASASEAVGLTRESSSKALRDAIDVGERARQLRAARTTLESTLDERFGGDLESACNGAGSRSLESLDVAERALVAEQANLERTRDDLVTALAERRTRRELRSSVGDAARVDDLARLRAQIVARAEELAVARAALHLLRKLQEGTEKRDHPVKERASSYFAALTEGAYASIEVDSDGGRPRLRAQLGEWGQREPDDLSTGTHDQLWLALRLAVVVEQARELRAPLLLDDVFVHFDERRTRAALRLVEAVSEHVQVIVLTHHDHVAHLAREVVRQEHLAEVVLPSPAAVSAEPRPDARESLERPPAVRRLRTGQGGRDDAALEELLLGILANSDDGLGRSACIEAAGDERALLEARFPALIDRLVSDGRVEAVGKKRGTRYRIRAPGLD